MVCYGVYDGLSDVLGHNCADPGALQRFVTHQRSTSTENRSTTRVGTRALLPVLTALGSIRFYFCNATVVRLLSPHDSMNFAPHVRSRYDELADVEHHPDQLAPYQRHPKDL